MRDHTTDDTTDGSRGRGVVRRLRDERGATLALVALGSTVLIGCAAISIDLGMLMTAKSQAQRAADSGAHAGAVALAISNGNQDLARTLAKAAAADNQVMGEAVVVQDADVTFPGQDSVRVRVMRNQARNNPIGTFFARILGFNEVDLAVDAMARVSKSNDLEFECLLPVTFLDRWLESSTGELAGPEDEWDPDEGDSYIPPTETGSTAYTDDDYGTRVLLTSNNAPGTLNPSWWSPWVGEGDQPGANPYRDRLRGNVCSAGRRLDDEVDTEPGNMFGPTRQGFDHIINQRPDEVWVEQASDCPDGCVKNQNGTGDIVLDSPRIRPVPITDPRSMPDPGKKEFQFSNFANVFVEEPDGNDYYGRFMGLAGGNPSGDGDPVEGDPLFNLIQIIE